MSIRARISVIALSAFLPLACSQPGAAQGNRAATQALFRFQSNFWVNLHHALFREGALRRADNTRPAPGRPAPLAAPDLSEGERRTWDNAVDYYAKEFAGRRLVFDERLVQINDVLSGQQNPTKLHAPALPPEVVRTLEQAAPAYRKQWWPAHDKANQAWIASMRPVVEKTGPEVVAQLEKLLKRRWSAPLTVDVAYFVAEVGFAYTTERPGHTTMASSQPTLQGLDGVETIFHEGAHTLTGGVETALSVECRAQSKACGDLWHALQFFTVGEVVKGRLREEGVNDFTPYAYKNGLYDRGEWPRFRKALELEWQPYLEGKTTFEDAIRQLVKGI